MANQSLRVLLLGATGTIGRATAAALIAAGHEVVAVVRPGASGPAGGARLEADVTQAGALAAAIGAARFDAVISCLASRTGAPATVWSKTQGNTLSRTFHFGMKARQGTGER